MTLREAAGGRASAAAGGRTGEAPAGARTLLSDRNSELLFSAACLWEVAIKRQPGRVGLQVDARLIRRRSLDNGYSERAITSEHAVAVGLPTQLHKDPFDRILVAQSMVEGTTLLTADPLVARHPGPIPYM